VKTNRWRVPVALALGFAAGVAASQLRFPARAQDAEAARGTALDDLLAGNKRFVEGKPLHPHADPQRVAELAKGQHPRAVVLSCADSRVAPEIVLDQGLGDIFTVRVAGNVLEPSITGSIEYAVEHLDVPLVLVLGHARCGAVSAALAAHGHPDALVGLGPNLAALVEHIEPVLSSLPVGLLTDAEKLDAAVEANVRLVASELERQSEVVRRAVEAKKTTITAGVYDLEHGGALRILEKKAR
jgi:carbonic anhydrase